MWNKIKIQGRDCYSRNTKTMYHEYTLGDVDRLNKKLPDQEERYGVGYGVGAYPFIEEYLPYEFEVLPSGLYRAEIINDSLYCYPHVLNCREECLEFSVIEKMQKDFKHFLDSRDKYNELNILHKRGILLYGPPGTGKTTLINKVLKDLIPEDTLVLFVTKYLTSDVMENLKKDSRFKIIIFEELTETLKYDYRASLLDFLDGELSSDNTFIIGTTNYPEKLPSNIINRPGRFDKFYKIDFLSKSDIRAYFLHFLKRDITDNEIKIFNKVTIAELKEILLLVLRDSLTLEEAHTAIKEQGILCQREFESKAPAGFRNEEDSIL